MNPIAEKIRVRYKYRNLVIRGKVHLPPEAARKIVGPDCAYKLYAREGKGERRPSARLPSTSSGRAGQARRKAKGAEVIG